MNRRCTRRLRPARGGVAPRGRGLLVAAMALLALAGGLSAQEGSPAGAVPAARLVARRAALAAAVRRWAPRGLIVVRSAEERSTTVHAQDNFFRQDDDFFYLTGLEEAGATLVGALEGNGASWVLYLPERVPAQEQWTGARLGPGPEAAKLAGLADVRPAGRLAADAPALRASAGGDSVALVLGGVLRRECLERAAVCADAKLDALRAGARGPLLPLAPYVAAQRAVKDEDEIARLRRAGAITADGVRAALAVAAPGAREYELEAAIEGTFRREGAERVGFPSIVGSGPNSTVLHYDKNRRTLQAGELVVMDVGAEFGYYTADVSRTIPVSGTFAPRQRAIYDLVLGAQQAVIDSVRPGLSLARLELIARAYMRDHAGTLCERPCDTYFNHGLSHGIGLQVHESGPSALAPLVPGMVFTVEPGIYLPGEALGVRIEDDVLVTETGHEVLTAGVPRAAREIEQLLRASRPRAGAGH